MSGEPDDDGDMESNADPEHYRDYGVDLSDAGSDSEAPGSISRAPPKRRKKAQAAPKRRAATATSQVSSADKVEIERNNPDLEMDLKENFADPVVAEFLEGRTSRAPAYIQAGQRRQNLEKQRAFAASLLAAEQSHSGPRVPLPNSLPRSIRS